MSERVMTDPKELVKIELKNAGFDIDSIETTTFLTDEMEGVGLFTIALYRKCAASAIYIVTDVIDEGGWHLGWEDNVISEKIATVIDSIVN